MSNPPSPRRNTIIIVVVVLILLCCCCVAIGGGYWLWNNGDNLLRDWGITSQVLPLALRAL